MSMFTLKDIESGIKAVTGAMGCDDDYRGLDRAFEEIAKEFGWDRISRCLKDQLTKAVFLGAINLDVFHWCMAQMGDSFEDFEWVSGERKIAVIALCLAMEMYDRDTGRIVLPSEMQDMDTDGEEWKL